MYFSIQTTDNRTISNAFFVPVQLTENFLAYLWTSFFSWNFSGQLGSESSSVIYLINVTFSQRTLCQLLTMSHWVVCESLNGNFIDWWHVPAVRFMDKKSFALLVFHWVIGLTRITALYYNCNACWSRDCHSRERFLIFGSSLCHFALQHQ